MANDAVPDDVRKLAHEISLPWTEDNGRHQVVAYRAAIDAILADRATRPSREDVLEEAAWAGYVVCAETRHVTLGDKVQAAIRSLKSPSPAVEGVGEPPAVALLRGPLSKRATSAEFNEWQAREVVAYIDQLSAPLPEPQEGFVLVPMEPTTGMMLAGDKVDGHEMLQSGEEIEIGHGWSNVAQVWRAMLAARPKGE